MGDHKDTTEALPPFLSYEHIATLAHVPISRVRRWHKRKKLPAVHPSGVNIVLFPRDQVLAWLRGRKRGGAQ